MITCQQYDYIEIACLYHLAIKLIFTDGKTICGIAQDISYNQNKQQCLLLHQQTGVASIEISTLKSMQALTANTHFSVINFN